MTLDEIIIDTIRQLGGVKEMINPYNRAEVRDVAPTVTTLCGSTDSSSTVLIFTYEEE